MRKFCHSLKPENAKAPNKTIHSDSLGLGGIVSWDETYLKALFR